MKRYLLIAVLALTFSFAGVVAAEHGSEDAQQPVAPSTPATPGTWVPHENGQGNQEQEDTEQPDSEQPEDANSDSGSEQDHPALPPAGAPIGAPGDNHGERGGLFRLFNKDAQQQRQDFLNSTQEDRAAFQDEHQAELEKVKADRAALEAVIKQKRDELQAEIEKIKQEKTTTRKTFVETHFADAVTNLHTLSDRIQAKIDELSGKGYDMTAATKALAAAKDSLATAETQLAALKAAAVSDTNDSTLTKPRELAQQVETALRAARDHFREAIQAIKTAVGIPADDAAEQQQPQQPSQQ